MTSTGFIECARAQSARFRAASKQNRIFCVAFIPVESEIDAFIIAYGHYIYPGYIRSGGNGQHRSTVRGHKPAYGRAVGVRKPDMPTAPEISSSSRKTPSPAKN